MRRLTSQHALKRLPSGLLEGWRVVTRPKGADVILKTPPQASSHSPLSQTPLTTPCRGLLPSCRLKQVAAPATPPHACRRSHHAASFRQPLSPRRLMQVAPPATPPPAPAAAPSRGLLPLCRVMPAAPLITPPHAGSTSRHSSSCRQHLSPLLLQLLQLLCSVFNTAHTLLPPPRSAPALSSAR